MIRGNGSLGSRSHKTSHSSYRLHNNNKECLKKKVLKCLWGCKFVDIGLLIPVTLLQIISDVVKLLDIGILIPATLTQVILEVVDVGQVFTATLPLLIT